MKKEIIFITHPDIKPPIIEGCTYSKSVLIKFINKMGGTDFTIGNVYISDYSTNETSWGSETSLFNRQSEILGWADLDHLK